MYNSLNHHMMRLLDLFYTEHDCNILDSRQKTKTENKQNPVERKHFPIY